MNVLRRVLYAGSSDVEIRRTKSIEMILRCAGSLEPGHLKWECVAPGHLHRAPPDALQTLSTAVTNPGTTPPEIIKF